MTPRRPHTPSHSLSDVVEGLRKGFLAGQYAPRQRLVEADLCEQFGVSRFVVRVALQELANDGLVEIQRNKGARVRPVSLEEAIEITEVRIALESMSAARAAERVTPAQAQEFKEIAAAMRRTVASGELLAYSDLNGRLHALVQAVSGNATCARTLERLRGQLVRHQFALALHPGRPSVSLPQHEDIVAAIVERSPAAAEEAMRAHLASVVTALRSLPVSQIG